MTGEDILWPTRKNWVDPDGKIEKWIGTVSCRAARDLNKGNVCCFCFRRNVYLWQIHLAGCSHLSISLLSEFPLPVIIALFSDAVLLHPAFSWLPCGTLPNITDLCSVNNLLVGGKDDGVGFIGVADNGKKAVRLSTADRCVTNLINNNKLCLPDIFQAGSCSPLSFCGIEDANQVCHLFKTYHITAVDSLQSQTAGHHGLAKARQKTRFPQLSNQDNSFRAVSCS